MLSKKEEKIVNLLLDKEMEERTIVALIHAMDTEERQNRMLHYLSSKVSLTKDELMSKIKEIFLAAE